MGRESKYFGANSFSPREARILRLRRILKSMGTASLKWRYRDRLHVGPGCDLDPGAMVIRGLGVAEMGRGVVVERGLFKVCFNLGRGSRLVLGDETWIQTFDGHTVFSTKPGAQIIAGDRCWFSGGLLGASKRITVGDHTLIGWGCMVLDSDLHRMDNDSPPVKPEPVRIGSHVWMPSYVTVLKGVSIGDHCVIGTGALVTKDIPSNSFAAGRPAKVIRRIGDRDRVE